MNKSGYYRNNKDLEYMSFVPTSLKDINIEVDKELKSLIDLATTQLKELNKVVDIFCDLNLFLYCCALKESLLSSQIEGTQATLEDIFATNQNETIVKSDVRDVFNYLKALDYAYKNPDNLPMCNRFIKNIHKELIAGIRGGEENKTPGEFRRSQNWIGGNSLKNALYIPPNKDDMLISMEELEDYINLDVNMNTLLKIGLIHYQFETIHPFLDGNGRVGRLLIVKLLCEWELLFKPCIYVSLYLKLHRAEYYDKLTLVRENGDYNSWLAFFLKAIIEACADVKDTAYSLEKLRKTNIPKIDSFPKSVYTLFEYMERKPIFTINDASVDLNLTYNTVSKSVNILVDLDIISKSGDSKRNRVFCYTEYLNILRGGTELDIKTSYLKH